MGRKERTDRRKIEKGGRLGGGGGGIPRPINGVEAGVGGKVAVTRKGYDGKKQGV